MIWKNRTTRKNLATFLESNIIVPSSPTNSYEESIFI